jgi:hypothetical protein
MAIVGRAFSPKEWSCWIKADGTNAGDTGAGASMYQLDVDSIGFPSLNPTQVMDVRTGSTGRSLKQEDFFQDNKLRVVELSLSGTLHNDSGHLLLIKNICNDWDTSSEGLSVAHNYAPPIVKYGTANAGDSGDSFTIVLSAPSVTNAKNIELTGCVCTNFAISADATAEGGRYKFSATVQTGYLPDLDDATAIGGTAYDNDSLAFLSTSSGHKVLAADALVNNFTLTLDNPAVFVGAAANGFDVVTRGAEFSVTVDTQIKYDENTDELVQLFDSQTDATAANSFVCTNDAKFGITMNDAVATNVAYSEGDIMMLDVSLKAVNTGSTHLVDIDVV